MRRGVVLAAVLLGGCSPADGHVRGLEVRVVAEDTALDGVERDAARLVNEWRAVVDHYHTARDEFLTATAEFERARGASNAASNTFRDAQQRWQRANDSWTFYRDLVEVATAIDAANMETNRSARSEYSCDTGMSTAAYRRMLTAQGVDLTGKDIDHIVPHALGGADHPANYEVIDSSLNRSLQDRFDSHKCYSIAGAKRCATAVAVSRKCGRFSGPLP